MTAPEGGTPELISDVAGLRRAIANLKLGNGPIAIDAERASGYRYSSRAYLIQLFRRGGGLHLIDPIPLEKSKEIEELSSLIGGEESVIHASSQDLQCLREFGIHPQRLFDTELGGRIAGFERVGLGSLCELLLGVLLAKEHSAVDWSIRPLRPEWLDYAALDVALLIDLRDAVAASLIEQGKLDWAAAEFQASLDAPMPPPKRDPWRRTSGMHQIRSRHELAIVRELWLERDRIAADLDLAPGRLLSDLIIVEAAAKRPESQAEFIALKSVKEKIRNDMQRSHLLTWWQVLQRAYKLDVAEWPEMRTRSDSLPPPRIWREKFPIAHLHLQNARFLIGQISAELKIPVENLAAPELIKRIAFDEGRERIVAKGDASLAQIREFMTANRARNWQIDLLAHPLALALSMSELPPEPTTTSE